MNLTAPWIVFCREIEALFNNDKDIVLKFDEESKEIKLFVKGEAKANALTKILPMTRTFGNVTVTVSVIPSNQGKTTTIRDFEVAFEGNPALAYTKEVERVVGGSHDYIVFQNKVVQFFNDDISDINGYKSTLYQDIAKDVFGEINNISFCTEKVKE